MCVAAAVIEQSLNLQTALGQPGQSLKNPTGFLGIRLIGQLSMAGDSAVSKIMEVELKDLDLQVRRPRFDGSKKIHKEFPTPEDKHNEVRNSLGSTYFKAIVSKRAACHFKNI
jgi:hypothetical protein